ncbi:hypothetical protein [Geminicoccus harenae]|uniref:hypothetical protein n=1 Tax=Geminicoccus harenae TaxID=2498453 RepID=UPI001C93B714|nr:hypothetical protein [Geminicoccus harenae]
MDEGALDQTDIAPGAAGQARSIGDFGGLIPLYAKVADAIVDDQPVVDAGHDSEASDRFRQEGPGIDSLIPARKCRPAAVPATSCAGRRRPEDGVKRRSLDQPSHSRPSVRALARPTRDEFEVDQAGDSRWKSVVMWTRWP